MSSDCIVSCYAGEETNTLLNKKKIGLMNDTPDGK